MTDCPLLHSHLSLCLHLKISLQLFLSSSFSPSIFLFLSRSFYHSVAFHLSQSLRLSFFPSSSLTSSSYLTSRYFSYPISLSLTLLSPLIINNLLSPSPSLPSIHFSLALISPFIINTILSHPPSFPLSSILSSLTLSLYHQCSPLSLSQYIMNALLSHLELVDGLEAKCKLSIRISSSSSSIFIFPSRLSPPSPSLLLLLLLLLLFLSLSLLPSLPSS